MNLRLPLFLALASAAAGFGAGYWIGRDSRASAGPGAGAGVAGGGGTPADTIRAYAEFRFRSKGAFRDPMEKLRVDAELEEARRAVLAFGPGAFDAVVAALGDPNPVQGTGEGNVFLDVDVRESVVSLLPALDPSRGAADLAARLGDEREHGRIRATAAGELARLERSISLPALTRTLEAAAERPWAGAHEVVRALEVLRGPEAGAAMLKALQSPRSDGTLRNAAGEALGRIRHAEAWDALEGIVIREPTDHNLRRIAIRSLAEIDSNRAMALVDEQIAVEREPNYRAFLESFKRAMSIR